MNDIENNAVAENESLMPTIHQLLSKRQQVLIAFCCVIGMDRSMDSIGREKLLQRFCEVLMDYSALWHFEIFDYIKKNTEQYKDVMSVAALHEERIVQATERAVVFNDKYDSSDHELSFDRLEADLSLLGEDIAARVEAEDRILNVMAVG